MSFEDEFSFCLSPEAEYKTVVVASTLVVQLTLIVEVARPATDLTEKSEISGRGKVVKE